MINNFNINLETLTVFLLALLSFLICLKQLLEWLYLWQKRQYRLDKMLDYLSTLEGRKIVFNKLFILRLFFVSLFIFYLVFSSTLGEILTTNFKYRLEFFLVSLNLTYWLFEVFLWKKKILSKKSFYPEITLKSSVIFLTSLISLSLLQIFFVFSVSSNFILLLILNITILFIPIITGCWILLFFPVDYLIKLRIFKKAKKYRENLTNLNVIAISGAFGKTTTKEILYQILSSQKKTEKTLKNQNSNMSCARKTLLLDVKTEYFLCELGSYKIGDGAEICQFIKPNIALISGLNLQHFALFGSRENIIKAESEAIKFLKDGDFVFVNYNHEMNREIEIPANLKLIKYGLIKENESALDVGIKCLECQENKTIFELKLDTSKIPSQQNSVTLETNLIGQGNLENLAGAIAVSLICGIKIEDIKNTIQNLPDFEITLKIKDKDWGKLIDDSHNANFDGVKNGIKILCDLTNIKNSTQKDQSKKTYESVLFLDDIPELGKKSLEIHTKLASYILQKKITKVVLLGRSFKNIIQKNLLENGFEEKNIIIWNERNKPEIISEIQKIPYKLILFSGYQSRKFLQDIDN
jgi:UDP-N-acetylmuramoyl-tripeptide--D-alanyl-D-alanine ligase